MTAAATRGSLTLQVSLRDVAGEPCLVDYTAAKDGTERRGRYISCSQSVPEPLGLGRFDSEIMEQCVPAPRISLSRIRNSRLQS
jgi:hypothetical protein